VAVLMLKQGLGRLIRSTTDRGILAVLDSRLLRRQYGRRFLESLPPARLVHDLDEVARFMA
jgi:ATP-dependent DNA helicase DinG